ncbi:cell surface glycoprotein CD200 receptor 1-B-like [Erpetoichthys calabaricus]|uniref:cell surface glycoprotein CD200 receptor 1-B-like n=1 Tax=Erpetoichthys calabaricus TaxID=27687 RepID=UPI0010A067F1|nr:cell surface glycoprotein CD200 receptor 1-B-like [Erpetoichthys calabaricus]XP_051782777.1 cell surface glycoprotein CD200 receptor 1-B-like [Erpetoichthys calabaricus]
MFPNKAVVTCVLLWTLHGEGFQLLNVTHGESVHLNCTDLHWSDINFETWSITKKTGHQCIVAILWNQNKTNTCKRHISIETSMDGKPFLNISFFTRIDEGNYKCETIYHGGFQTNHFRLTATETRHVQAHVGKDLTLSCSDRNWTEISSETWKTSSWNGSECVLIFQKESPDLKNSCADERIQLQTTRENKILLHISQFTSLDEGVYICESAYNGWMDKIQFAVSVVESDPQDEIPVKWIVLCIFIACFLITFVFLILFLTRRSYC